MDITPEELRAQDAKAILDSTVFKESFDKVSAYIESQAVSCNPDNKDLAQRIILSKQLLAHVKRELVNVINNGAIAVNMKALEENRGIINRVLRR